MNSYFYLFTLVPILDILAGKNNYDTWNITTNSSWISVYKSEFEVGAVGLLAAVLSIVFYKEWDWVDDV